METNSKTCIKCNETKPAEEYYKSHGNTCKVCFNKADLLRRKKNADLIKEQHGRWETRNREKSRDAHRIWSSKNKSKVREYRERWNKKNPEKLKEIHRNGMALRRSLPKGRLRNTSSRSIWTAVRRGTKTTCGWESLVGYSLAQLMCHLEKQFTPEMSWENHGSYWHVDHKIPVAAFNFERPEDLDFKRCWALENLQPLEKIANIKKGARLTAPFQPSLTI